tara:strand:- start:2041 stop:2235 length:195 start_codon:yes stop_codon:yes gene_type:complete
MTNKNKFIAFRAPESVRDRLSVVAECEHLTVSDIVRRATFQSMRELEEKHHLASPRPPVREQND